MGIKLGSIVMILMIVFIAKISYETATNEKINDPGHLQVERTPASIDQSYQDHMNKR
jgi:hypothetical protein